MIVADTNVVSEFMKDRPDPSVMAWAEGLGTGELTISVVTVQEIEWGLRRLPSGRRRRDLERRWHELADAYADIVLLYDVPAARSAAQILVGRAAKGHQMNLADAEIAGICVSRECHLATRNVRDFADIAPLTLVNPFD